MSWLRKLPLRMTNRMRGRILVLHRRGHSVDDIENATGCANADICSVLIDLKTSDAIERNLVCFEVGG